MKIYDKHGNQIGNIFEEHKSISLTGIFIGAVVIGLLVLFGFMTKWFGPWVTITLDVILIIVFAIFYIKHLIKNLVFFEDYLKLIFGIILVIPLTTLLIIFINDAIAGEIIGFWPFGEWLIPQ
ncbi:MAG: hypothetical protein IK045_01050 [Bacteroidales bacterium]|nr:hypothetical protein [Bacteroidales bacterium]